MNLKKKINKPAVRTRLPNPRPWTTFPRKIDAFDPFFYAPNARSSVLALLVQESGTLTDEHAKEKQITFLLYIRHAWHRFLTIVPTGSRFMHSSFLLEQRAHGRTSPHFLLSLDLGVMALCTLGSEERDQTFCRLGMRFLFFSFGSALLRKLLHRRWDALTRVLLRWQYSPDSYPGS